MGTVLSSMVLVLIVVIVEPRSNKVLKDFFQNAYSDTLPSNDMQSSPYKQNSTTEMSQFGTYAKQTRLSISPINDTMFQMDQ